MTRFTESYRSTESVTTPSLLDGQLRGGVKGGALQSHAWLTPQNERRDKGNPRLSTGDLKKKIKKSNRRALCFAGNAFGPFPLISLPQAHGSDWIIAKLANQRSGRRLARSMITSLLLRHASQRISQHASWKIFFFFFL